jgi:hypothetical protein
MGRAKGSSGRAAAGGCKANLTVHDTALVGKLSSELDKRALHLCGLHNIFRIVTTITVAKK